MTVTMCTICPNRCALPESGRGKCGVRMNVKGVVYALTYGKPCAVHVDPIEKKPCFHFLPGTQAFSIATAGCCLSCKYCQNWQISQARPEDVPTYDLPPERVVDEAVNCKCASIAYTYTEPTVFYEYMLDTAKAARQRGIKNIYVTCGYINEKPLAELAEYIDAANVDLKGFTDEFYRTVSGGKLEPVKHTIQYLYKKGVIVEVTNLVVPTLNDKPDMIREMCRWLVNEVSPDVPLHFSRFHPQYQLQHLPPTPVGKLREARDIAYQEGVRYVYIGNVPEEEEENTLCPACKKVVVARRGYKVGRVDIVGNRCAFCNENIYGVWSV